jgi:hypothetical protein
MSGPISVLLAAENFAFGPAGKMLALASALRPYFKTIGFAGAGTAADLASHFPFDDFSTVDDPRQWGETIAKYDAVVTVMERACAEESINQRKPVVWIDTLFWWWSSLPEYLQSVDLYVYQRSLDASRNVKRFGPRLRRMLGVGPLIDTVERTWRPRPRTLMLCYGGIEAEGFYQIGKDSTYPYTMTRLLLEKVNLSEFDELTVVGNRRVTDQLADTFRDRRLHSTTMAHTEFLDAITTTEVVLAVPGLETSLEAFYYGVPVIHLPPSNATQYWQLEHFRNLGLAPASVHFTDFLPRLELDPLSREERNAAFLKQLAEFERSGSVLALVASKLDRCIRTRSEWSVPVIAARQEYVRRLGGNGLPEAAAAICHMLGKTPVQTPRFVDLLPTDAALVRR